MRERCKQCPSLIPASRMAKHLELKHNVELKSDMLENASEDDAPLNEDDAPSTEESRDGKPAAECLDSVQAQKSEEGQSNNEFEEESSDTTNTEKPSDELKNYKVDDNSTVDAEPNDLVGDNDEDEIIPMGLSKRKRAVIDDDDDDAETEQPMKKPNSPIKEASSNVSDTECLSACSYCPAKLPTAEDLKTHISKEHAWLDAEIDDKVTYGGSDIGEGDYEDLDIDYDEEGDDFFEDGNLVEMPVVALGATNLFDPTEDCDFCEETVTRSSMNQHLLKQHDINMMEADTPVPMKTNPAMDPEVTPCPICKTPIATAILAIHITYYHAEMVNQEVTKSKEVLKDEEGVSVGEQCEMCDEKMAANMMVAHLLEAHDIKVIDEKLEESSEVDTAAHDTPVGEDPYAIPDFLREKPKRPKFKCHHCQKKFSTREKVDIHVNKRHEGRCQVCVTYKLVQENRYIGIMKQLNKTAKGVKEDVLPAGDNIVTGQVEDIIFNYEDLYPEEEFEECEECEDDFYWRNRKEHSCDLSQANVRMMNGQKFKWGDPQEADDESEDGEEYFEYITNRLGKSIVDRASKDTSTAYVGDIVNDIVNKALDDKQFNPIKFPDPPISKKVRQQQFREDQHLQLKSQILAYRFLKRKDTLPNIVERAASYENFRDSPADERRKLSEYFYKEYKEDIEKEEKELYEKKDEEKKRLQEETLREMTTAKLYDYSKYFIPTIKPPKKQRKLMPKKEQKTPLLDSMMNTSMDNSGFKLPSGSALQMNDRNYLNKLKQHQEKTVKKLNMIQQGSDRNSTQYQETMRELEVDNRRLENLNKAPSFMNPFRPSFIKQEPGALAKPAAQLGSMPGISIKRVEPQPPKLEVKREAPSPALQRLQSLGLSISVGQNGQSRPLEPPKPKPEPGLNRSYPGQPQQKPEPVLNNSVLEQYRQLAGMKKQTESDIQARPQAQSLWNASARGREPQQPARNQMQPQQHLQREQLQIPRTPMPQSREPVHREPEQPGRNLMHQAREPLQPVRNNYPHQNKRSANSYPSRDPARESFKKPAPRPHAPQRPPQNMPARPYPPPPSRAAPSRPVSLAKAEYTDSQKLQLKSQILAYRMVSREERLPQIVKLAASNTNLKSMNIPKNEMRSLSNFFRQEYSAIA